MSDFTVYTKPDKPAPRLELTPKAMEELKGNKDEMAEAVFIRLKQKGLLPPNAKIDGKVIGYQPKPGEDPSKVPTYREAIIAFLSNLADGKSDLDMDKLYDFSISDLTEQLRERGIITKEGNIDDEVMRAMTTSKNPGQQINDPTPLTYFCDNRISEDTYTNPSPGIFVSGFGQSSPPSSEVSESETAQVAGFKSRFEGNPYVMQDAVAYFKDFAATHSTEEFQKELHLYLTAYYTHVDRSPLSGSNFTEKLGIGTGTDLTKHLTIYKGKAVIDCNGFVEIANTIIQGSGIQGATATFIGLSFFGDKTEHIALLVTIDDTSFIVNNNQVVSFDDPSNDRFAQYFSNNGNYLVSAVVRSKIYANCSIGNKAPNPIKALSSKSPTVKQNAIKYLTRHPDPKATKALASLVLNEKDPEIRKAAIEALAVCGDKKDPSLLALYHNLAGEKDLYVKADILKTLHALGVVDQATYSQEMAMIFKEAKIAVHSDQARYRDLVDQLLDEGEDGVKILADLFDHPEAYENANLLGSLIIGRIEERADTNIKGHPNIDITVIPLLEKAFQTSPSFYCVRILDKLSEISSDPRIIALYEKMIGSNVYCNSAILGLAKLAEKGNKQALSILIKLLDHPDIKIKKEALSCLSHMDGRSTTYVNGEKVLQETKNPLLSDLIDPDQRDKLVFAIIKCTQSILQEEGVDYRFDNESLYQAIKLLTILGGEKASAFLASLQEEAVALKAIAQELSQNPFSLPPEKIKLGETTVAYKSNHMFLENLYRFLSDCNLTSSPATFPSSGSFASIR